MHYWDYLSKELPEKIHNLFPQISCSREKTFAAGQSMGGYGAMRLGLGTDHYGAVASMSGAVHNHTNISEVLQFGPMAFWEGIFGSFDEIQGSENDIFALSDKQIGSGHPLPQIYISCGRQDVFYSANVEAKRRLEEIGYQLDYRESDGTHDWNYWCDEIQRILDWLPLKNM